MIVPNLLPTTTVAQPLSNPSCTCGSKSCVLSNTRHKIKKMYDKKLRQQKVNIFCDYSRQCVIKCNDVIISDVHIKIVTVTVRGWVRHSTSLFYYTKRRHIWEKTKTKIKVSIHVKGQNLVWDNLVPLFLVNEQPFFTLVAQKYQKIYYCELITGFCSICWQCCHLPHT